MRVKVDGLDIAFRQSGTGPPLVLLHGLLADSRIWRPQLADLADGFTVIAWDEPGAGRSSNPPGSFALADYADTLGGLFESLGIEWAHVGGLSWGGVVAQEFYRRHPDWVTSLILADTYAGWRGSLGEGQAAERLDACLQQAEQPPEDFVESWIPGLLTPAAPPEAIEEVLSIMTDFHPAGFRTSARAIAGCDSRDLLPEIEVPVLLIWGEEDIRSSPEVAARMHRIIPDSQLVEIPDAGHLSNLEQPAQFNDALRKFCRLAGNR